ncbi:MAG TPA: hypothetical protein VK856_05165 [Anaerolineaceae bacterium]|nr:hypothetical protein [Anaerolineaceae bacterium]
MRDYEFDKQMRGNSPHMVYQALRVEIRKEKIFEPTNSNIFQTLKVRLSPDKSIIHPSADNPPLPSKK